MRDAGSSGVPFSLVVADATHYHEFRVARTSSAEATMGRTAYWLCILLPIVTVVAQALSGKMSACHCEMCRRWSGSIQMGIEAREDDVTVTGPVKTYRSSDFAERAWCGRCGSALWLRNVAGSDVGHFEFVPGLFENAAGATLVREVYADCCPDGYALAGDLERVSKADYEAKFDHVPEERP